VNNDFIEKIITKSMLIDSHYLALITGAFSFDLFDIPAISDIVMVSIDHFTKYKNIPSKEILLNSIDTTKRDTVIDVLDDIDSIDFDVAKNYEYLMDLTNEYLKRQSIKKAILKSVDVIKSKEDDDDNTDYNIIRKYIEDALSKDIRKDLGHNYFEDMGQRLKRILLYSDVRIPTYYPVFDEIINGGFPPFTLSVIIGKVHGGKSQVMSNFAARQVLHGYTVVNMTLEMSEDAYAQRYDSIFTNFDINKLYISKDNIIKLKDELKKIKDSENRGCLFIKQFPTGEASVQDLRIYLRELSIRNIKPDIIYADYINLMKPSYKAKGDMYSDVKRIAEELRALSFEFKCPVVSVSQLNREGSMSDFEDVNLFHISECISEKSIVNHKNKGIIPICDLNINDEIENDDGFVKVEEINRKKKRKYIIKTKSGKIIECSKDHEFPTNNGIKSISRGLKCFDKLYVKIYMIMEDEIVKIIETDEYIDMIDIKVSGNNLFFANNILTHNSMGTISTSDFLAILGTDSDMLVYQNELHYKIEKNRLGGRVGEIGKMYWDTRSLRLYDSTELERWLKDIEISGDDRKLAEQREDSSRRGRGRR